MNIESTPLLSNRIQLNDSKNRRFFGDFLQVSHESISVQVFTPENLFQIGDELTLSFTDGEGSFFSENRGKVSYLTLTGSGILLVVGLSEAWRIKKKAQAKFPPF